MKAQSLKTLIDLHQNKLTIETSYNQPKKQIISIVQLNGKVAQQREMNVTKENGDENSVLEKLLPETHKSFISELESLFSIQDKINEKPSADKCFMLGIILLQRGFYGDALKQFQKVLDVNPKHVQATKHYGIALILQEDYENARYVLSSAAETAPGYPDILFYLGNVYLYQRNYEVARQCYQAALQINPNYADAHLKMATCALGVLANENSKLVEAMIQEFKEEALDEAQLAIQINPRIAKSTLLTGIHNLKEGKYPMAFKNFMEARPKFIPKTGSEMIYFYTLKLLYGDKGVGSQETDYYINQLEQIVEENPGYADIRLHYSVAHLIKSNFIVSRSLREMNKSLTSNPGFQKALGSVNVLSEIYKKMMLVVRNIYSGDQ